MLWQINPIQISPPYFYKVHLNWTRYELDGPGIESRWKQDFLHPSRPALGPIQPPAQWEPGLFSWGKATEAGEFTTHHFPASMLKKE